MSEHFQRLLDATIRHLEDLKADRAQFVSVTPEALACLASPSRPPERPPVANRPVLPTPARTLPTSPRPPLPAALPAPFPSMVSHPASSRTSDTLSPPRGEGWGEGSIPEIKSAMSGDGPGQDRPSLTGEGKIQAMAELRARAMVCVKCPHLAASRKQVVFGVGDLHSPLMFVGEAPGADEDQQGEPFVGRAGQLLTRIIQTMGFSRETVYIANVLKCRPDTPAQTAGNRKPTPEEMQTCLPYLLAQIEVIKPKIIVALGGTAMEGLFGKPVFITRIRGQFQPFQNIPVMPTFHPSYLLRNEALAEKRKIWEDLLQVLEKLGRPISEKQRNFFLRGK